MAIFELACGILESKLESDDHETCDKQDAYEKYQFPLKMFQEDVPSSQVLRAVKKHHRVYKRQCGTQKSRNKHSPMLFITDDLEKEHETIKEVDNKCDDETNHNLKRTTRPKRRKFTEFSETDNDHIRSFFDMNCKICYHYFSTFKNAQDHYREAHGKNGFLQCCDKKFRRPCEIKDHIRKHLQPESFK